MNLDKTTYGRTPAALYLTSYLNEQGDEVLNRKVGRMLSRWRRVINDVICSHLQADEMSTHTFNTLLPVLDGAVRATAQALPDALCRKLVTNLLVGELRTWKTRSARTARLQDRVNRTTKAGETVPELKVTPAPNEETDEERIEKLKQRSCAYLARKSKMNTLY